MKFTWSPTKCEANIKAHALDFADAPSSEKPPSASRKSTSMKSKTDLAQFEKGVAKPTPDHPEADVQHIVRGMVRKGLKMQPAKASISLRVDQDVLEWFKAQGAGYQTRINAVLKAYRDASV